MKQKVEDALTALLTKHQDSDTVTEVVRRLTGLEVRLIGDFIFVEGVGSTWVKAFKVKVILEVQ